MDSVAREWSLWRGVGTKVEALEGLGEVEWLTLGFFFLETADSRISSAI